MFYYFDTAFVSKQKELSWKYEKGAWGIPRLVSSCIRGLWDSQPTDHLGQHLVLSKRPSRQLSGLLQLTGDRARLEQHSRPGSRGPCPTLAGFMVQPYKRPRKFDTIDCTLWRFLAWSILIASQLVWGHGGMCQGRWYVGAPWVERVYC